ncbi:Glycosyltransferase involved in cell wall bisynthesis [Desulfocicer vacuolatum DSM 3385]|uniref:Glycosyltransferase involved in cell wall bisynthesis n=1 Tax=Desulfocicer vacuolatum DSM 3385 TaxID=1121400 RepID=A0A1W2BJA3_9BACT|nr:glycosyltransferase family 4 protein [Desulfocicer vacuolatum]SMC72997.1 Glycosyltransferase involved in cell wall bisynthesis [Desulfocicer vacuolatum DSM 3385]
MKILLISHSPNLYGAERSLLDLAERLAQSKHLILSLCPAKGAFSKALSKLNIPTFYMPIHGIGKGSIKEILLFIIFFPFDVLWLSRWMKRNKINIVYLNTVNSLCGAFAAKIAGIRSVWHIREVKKPKNKFLTKTIGFIIKLMASEVIFNSYSTMSAFMKQHPPSCHVIYNGVEPKGSFKKIMNDVPVVIGFAGQLIALKRPERFLYIFHQLKKIKGNNIKGIIAGNGSMLPELRTLAKSLRIDQDVTFTGYLTDLNQFYTEIDILILTSDYESFGRVLAEAMSYGRTVIASAVGGVPELVKNEVTGYLVKKQDTAAYSQKIIDLVNDPKQCQKMGDNARKIILERFSKHQYQENLISLLTQKKN